MPESIRDNAISSIEGAEEFYELWAYLLQASYSLFELRNKELQPAGLTTLQAAILLFMHLIGDDATPARISRWILRKPNTVSAILDRMEQRGLVTRSKDMEKKNWVRVNFTEKGREALQISLQGQAVRRVLSLLSSEERQRLKAYLNIIRDNSLIELGRSPRRATKLTSWLAARRGKID